jgi:hypothetical protein
MMGNDSYLYLNSLAKGPSPAAQELAHHAVSNDLQGIAMILLEVLQYPETHMPAATGAAAGPDTSHHDHHDTVPRAQTLIEGDALL